MKIGAVLSLIWLVMGSATVLSQEAPAESVFENAVFVREAEIGLNLLYNMKFRESEAIFSRLAAQYPDHPAGPFMQGLNVWWEILVDLEDKSHDKDFTRAMKEVMKRSDRRLKKNKRDVDGLFFKGLALGLRGRLRSNRGSYLSSGRDAKRSYKYVVKAAEVDPSNDDFYFGWGIYDYFVDILPEQKKSYRLLKLFFKGGDRERGIAELERTWEHGRFMKAEAAYFLVQIHQNFERNYSESVKYVTWLREEYPDNSFFHALEGRVHASAGRWSKAEPIFRDITRLYTDEKPGYNPAIAEQAYYYLARIDLAYNRFADALEHANLLSKLPVRDPEKRAYQALGMLRRGMALDGLGERERAISAYERCLKMKNASDSRGRAKKYLKEPYR